MASAQISKKRKASHLLPSRHSTTRRRGCRDTAQGNTGHSGRKADVGIIASLRFWFGSFSRVKGEIFTCSTQVHNSSRKEQPWHLQNIHSTLRNLGNVFVILPRHHHDHHNSAFAAEFVADGVFYAELNEFFQRELAAEGYSGVEVRVTPARTEIIIRATQTQEILGSGAKGCEVVVSGKLRGARAKAMKFVDGFMIHSGQPTKDFVDTAVRHVLLRQGVLGVR
ncbi:40S ribosomal protein S3, partial [Mortierella alpina]